MAGGREGGKEGIGRGALTVRVAAEVTTKPPTAAVMAARKAAGGDGEGRQRTAAAYTSCRGKETRDKGRGVPVYCGTPCEE